MEDKEWDNLIKDPQEFLDSVLLLVDDNLDNIPQGPITLYLRIKGENFEVTSETKNSLTHENEKVYWLPYKKDGVSSVTPADLQKSDCKVFLTSTFTGCRFSMTDEYIAHIPSGRKELLPDSQTMEPALRAAESGDYSQLNQINAQARDVDEQALSGPEGRARHAQVRRTVTPTKLSKMPAIQKETYQASAENNPMNPPENAVVIGVREKTDQPFHFFAQITFSNRTVKTVDFGVATAFNLETFEGSLVEPPVQKQNSPQSSTSFLFQELKVNPNKLESSEQKSGAHQDKEEPLEKHARIVKENENKRGKKRLENPETETTNTRSNTNKRARNESSSTEDDSDENKFNI